MKAKKDHPWNDAGKAITAAREKAERLPVSGQFRDDVRGMMDTIPALQPRLRRHFLEEN